MKKTIYNDIQSLFKSGEIQTIKFSKNGNVSVKFTKQSHSVTYPKGENVIEQIKKDAEFFSKENPKVLITIDEVNKLNGISNELNLPKMFTCGENFNPKISGIIPMFEYTKTIKKSRFERFYDSVTNFLSGGKSFAPNECKTFA